MNNPYQTPCSPMKCDRYVYGELCGNENNCTKYLNYQAIRQFIKDEKKKGLSWHTQPDERATYSYRHKKQKTRMCQR